MNQHTTTVEQISKDVCISLIDMNLDHTAIVDDTILGPKNRDETQNLDSIIADNAFPEPSSNINDDNEGTSTMNETGKEINEKPRVSTQNIIIYSTIVIYILFIDFYILISHITDPQRAHCREKLLSSS